MPSIATGHDDAGPRRDRLAGIDPAWLGLGFALLALFVYVASNPERQNFYNHFVWQADAFLSGSAAIPWPVSEGPVQNGYFQDVYPLTNEPGRALIPFPPLPALLLLPLVAAYGLSTDAALVAAVIGALDVGLAWRLAARLTPRRDVAAVATAFFAFGTVHWYAAMLGSTWFLAHVVATLFLLLGITAALDAERATAETSADATTEAGPLLDQRQLRAGLLFGLAALARLTTILGAPFFVLVGRGGTALRRALAAGLGAALPVLALLAYNLATTGHLFHPGYEHLYRTEIRPAPDGGLAQLLPLLSGITYHPGEWAIEDLRYVPQNLLIMLGWLPVVRPECGLSLLDQACPLLKPDRIGMSLLLTSPAYLLAVPFALRAWRRRIVLGSLLAIGAIAFVNLAHFSQGWVQFGYRFSNDFAPFGLVLVTLAIAQRGVDRLVLALVGISIVVNAWGVYWGVVSGW
ncbi:MAG TPA: hypothetical protein VFK38_01395 [Candidatus Limnocylindrales bacterium]|nr:hypothetical protein [Candidatus Limnocylindrales bacterium]